MKSVLRVLEERERDEEHKEMVSVCKDSLRSLANLTENLTYVAKVQSNMHEEITTEEMNPHAMIQTSHETFKFLA